MESKIVLFQLEGLPFSVNKKDIQKFFRDSSLTEDDISILKNAENGRCLGLAFVRFHTELEANVATRHCGVEIGGNRVTLKRTTFQEMVITKKRMESADTHPSRRKISEPISVSPDRTGLRSPSGPGHSRRSEERGKVIHRLPFQQVEHVTHHVREPVEKKRNRSRSPHLARSGGSSSLYQSKESPRGLHNSGTHHEQGSHRHEKIVRHQYGRDGLWGEWLREPAAQPQRNDSRSNHVEMMTWSSSGRGSGRSEAASERESRAREEPRRVDVSSSSTRGSSVYRSHQSGSSDGEDYLRYSGSRIRETEDRRGHFRRRSHELESLHDQPRDRSLGAEDHRGYSGGRYREVEIRDRHPGSRNRETEVRARHVGSSSREVEVRGRFSRNDNREADVRGGHSGSRHQAVEVRGGHLESRSHDADVRGRGPGSKNREDRGHWGGRDEEGSRSGRDPRDRESAVGYRGSLDRSQRQDVDNSETQTTHKVKLMGFPDWFAFKEIRHMLGRSVTVVHGGIHFVADVRRPTAYVTVEGDESYKNALKLDGLPIDKQCTLTVLGCTRSKADGGENEGDDLRRVLEKRREPRNPSSGDNDDKRSAYSRKRSASPVPHPKLSREVATRERSYSPGRAQKLVAEFWATDSRMDEPTEYPSTQTEGVGPQPYPAQWQDENGHFVSDVPVYHTARTGQSPHGDFQSQVESGFMEAAMEYPEYFTREELAYTGEQTQQLRFDVPFSSQFSDDFTVAGMSLDSVFHVPISATEAIAHRPAVATVRERHSTSPAPDSTLASVVHVVHKGKEGSIPSEYRRSDGSTGAHIPATVRCTNLPTSVVVTDILSFFQDHSVSYDNVRIQCDDKGQPTGKCFVTFPSYQQAALAVRRSSNQRLKDKKINVEVVLS